MSNVSGNGPGGDTPQPLLDVEAVVLGSAAEVKGLEPLRALIEEAARVVWAAQTGHSGELAVTLIPGPAPYQNARHRVVMGAYSPETRTVIVFVEAIERARRERTYLRQLLRTLAHEVTHAVQHRGNPALRPGRKGSAALPAGAYAEDPLERAAAAEENAFDHALFSPDPPRASRERISGYQGRFTHRLVELIDALEEKGGS